MGRREGPTCRGRLLAAECALPRAAALPFFIRIAPIGITLVIAIITLFVIVSGIVIVLILVLLGRVLVVVITIVFFEKWAQGLFSACSFCQVNSGLELEHR